VTANGVTMSQWGEERTNLNVAAPSNSLEALASFDCGWGGWVRTWGDCLEAIDYFSPSG
jgi:hypothetical protein